MIDRAGRAVGRRVFAAAAAAALCAGLGWHRASAGEAAGKGLTVKGDASAAAAGQEAKGLAVKQDDKTLTVRDGERMLLEYRFAGVPFKPYVSKWLSPGGVNILRDAPHDHLHHHAMMFAIAADGVNFWEEQKSCGRQVHRSFEGVKTSASDGQSTAEFTELLDWASADGKPVLSERRTIRVHCSPELGASLLTWQTRLEPAAGKARVTLGGAHYHGLGMRFVTSMDKVGKFFNPTGKGGEVVRGTERLLPAKWCAYTAPADGKTVTVAMFDHPDNPRPALWFTMTDGFAYLSATLNLWKQPLTLEAGKGLVLRYGAALWDGQATPEQIDKLRAKWLALCGQGAKGASGAKGQTPSR